MNADIPGADIGIVVDHVYVVHRNPEDLRHDLGEDRLRALSDVGRTREDVHFPVIVDLYDSTAAVRFVDSCAAAHVHQRGHSEAPAFLLPPFSIPAQPALHLFHAFFHAAACYLEILRRSLSRLIGIDHPELIRIDARGLGQLVEGGLDGECGLGVPVTSHGLAVSIVRVDALGHVFDVRDLVKG